MSRRTRTVTRNGMEVLEYLDANGNVVGKKVLGRTGEAPAEEYQMLDWTKLLKGLGISVVNEKAYGGRIQPRKAAGSSEKN